MSNWTEVWYLDGHVYFYFVKMYDGSIHEAKHSSWLDSNEYSAICDFYQDAISDGDMVIRVVE